MPLSQCTYLGGGTKARICLNFSRSKMASCPFEVWWLFDPKPDRNLPLWNQKWKENMLQNIRLQRNGRRSPRSDNNMNDSCVKIYSWKAANVKIISFILADFLFHPRPRKFRNVRSFECKLRTMSYYGTSRDFWKQSCSWMEVSVSVKSAAMDIFDNFGRRRIDRPLQESS